MKYINKFLNKKGFTLAEIILTLTIVGSIASFTIPPLIQNIQDSILKIQWRNAFSIFSQVSRKITINNAGSLNEVFEDDNDMRDKLSAYIRIIKKCDRDSALGPDGCWNSQTYTLAGASFTYWNMTTWSRMILNNGMLVAINQQMDNCTYDRAAKDNGCGTIAIDVNGFNKPNTIGKDIFFSFITEDGSFEPFGKLGDYWNATSHGCNLKTCSTANGFTCAAQYLRQ